MNQCSRKRSGSRPPVKPCRPPAASHTPPTCPHSTAKSAAPDSRFRSRAELDAIYADISRDADVIAYCRIGERSSHTWFVLTHLLGYENVRNYDGSWTEWGNAVRVPIVKGDEPGEAPAR